MGFPRQRRIWSFNGSYLYSTIILTCLFFPAPGQQPAALTRTLIVIFDGLRPDYITPQHMPHVHAFRETGSYGADHHSVFPTVTRVNASSYATGSYPRSHGLMGNTVYFPEVDKTKGLNTGEAIELMRIAEGTGDRLLTSVSVGEILKAAGAAMMVYSSGSSGQAFLQNHTIGNGGIIHPQMILPSTLKTDVLRTLGEPPAAAKPNASQHEWVAKALIHYSFVPDGPLVSAIWFSDPDGAAHSDGIGSPAAMESIRVVDEKFGAIMRALEDKGLASSFNIIITADHGFVTDVGQVSLNAFLTKEGLKQESDPENIVLAGNAIYVRDRDRTTIRKIVSSLQAQPWVGAIFTQADNPSSPRGWVEGTLSFESIHWDHPSRAADILVDYHWDSRKNSFGYEGTSFAPGVAGHGGSSPYEIHIPLIAAGPGFKKKFQSTLPTSNIDIVPTILHLHGLPVPPGMDGRVLTELLAGSENIKNENVKKEKLETTVTHAWGTYHLVLERSAVGKQRYVNYTRVKRKFK